MTKEFPEGLNPISGEEINGGGNGEKEQTLNQILPTDDPEEEDVNDPKEGYIDFKEWKKQEIANIKDLASLKKIEEEKDMAGEELEKFLTEDVYGDRVFSYDFSLKDLKKSSFVLERALERGEIPDNIEDVEKLLLEIQDLEDVRETLLKDKDQKRVRATLEETNRFLKDIFEKPELASFVSEYRKKLEKEFLQAKESFIQETIDRTEAELENSRRRFMELVSLVNDPAVIEKIEEFKRQEKESEGLKTVDKTLKELSKIKTLVEQSINIQNSIIKRILKALESDNPHNLDIEEVELLINKNQLWGDEEAVSAIREAMARYINRNCLTDKSQFLPWRASKKSGTEFNYRDALNQIKGFEGRAPTVPELKKIRDEIKDLPEEYREKIEEILGEYKITVEALRKDRSLMHILQPERNKNNPGSNSRNNIYLAFDKNMKLTPEQRRRQKKENERADMLAKSEKEEKEQIKRDEQVQKEERLKRRQDFFDTQSRRLKTKWPFVESEEKGITYALRIEKYFVKNGIHKGDLKYRITKIFEMNSKELSINTPQKIDSKIATENIVSKETLIEYGFSGEDIDRAVEVDKAVE